MRKFFRFLSLLFLGGFCSVSSAAAMPGFIVITDYVDITTGQPVSDAIQAVIDSNPNRTLYFPDGVYLLDKPICTPADPTKSVDLQLSNYATLKAVDNWEQTEAMVRLGGIHPYNSITINGSNYSITGGIIDGSNVADGISIDSGRETVIRQVSIKHTRIGIFIKRGANSGSSDADITNVNIVGNGTRDSIGVLVHGCDNTLTNMRIANVVTGIDLVSGGNYLRNIHPLFTGKWEFYEESTAFINRHDSNNWFDFCYSDNFATGYRLGARTGGVFHNCFCFWYSANGERHTIFSCESTFEATVDNLHFGFRAPREKNQILETGADGGKGFFSNLPEADYAVNVETSKHRLYLK